MVSPGMKPVAGRKIVALIGLVSSTPVMNVRLMSCSVGFFKAGLNASGLMTVNSSMCSRLNFQGRSKVTTTL